MWCALLTVLKKNIAGNYILTVIFNTLGSCLLAVYLWTFADVKDA